MGKIIQWVLVAAIALFLLGAITMKLLAASTESAREIAVAKLKEKLRESDFESASDNSQYIESEMSSESSAGRGPGVEIASTDDLEALRAKWVGVFARMTEVGKECQLSDGAWDRAMDSVLPFMEVALTPEEQEELQRVASSFAPVRQEMLHLLELQENLAPIFELSFLHANRDVFFGLWDCEHRLQSLLWLAAALGEYEDIYEYFFALACFSGVGYGSVAPRWELGAAWNAELLKPVIASESVSQEQWDRLFHMLSGRREQAFFARRVEHDTRVLLDRYENWEQLQSQLKFSEAPVSYLRTWAYPRLTPALFNHDIDRYSQAMYRLVDLARGPYFEVKSDLAQFCEEFDVEPGMDEIKVIRSNPGWYYVVYLSRHAMEANAHDQAFIDLLRITVNLEHYQRETGSYPDSLETLDEALGGSVPLNPLMDEPYVYERLEDDYRLGYRQEEEPHLVEAYGLAPIWTRYWQNPVESQEEGDEESNSLGSKEEQPQAE